MRIFNILWHTHDFFLNKKTKGVKTAQRKK